jgi:hypothetical protein
MEKEIVQIRRVGIVMIMINVIMVSWKKVLSSLQMGIKSADVMALHERPIRTQ